MSNILLARIDDRLIHGQVMTSWVRFVKSKNILIIDDETYHDTFIRSFITMVVPRGIQIQVLVKMDRDFTAKAMNSDHRR